MKLERGIFNQLNEEKYKRVPGPDKIDLSLLLPLQGEGLRFNEGKPRLDLVPQSCIDGVADVLTFGAKKYAPNNWRKGMPWSKVTASLYRHMAAISRGEDYDEESGLLHVDHVLTNAAFLKEYYKIFPQGDDRTVKYLHPKKIGLDIDGVLGDFVGHLMRISGNEGHVPIHWNDPIVRTEFDKVKTDPNFWSNIPPLLHKEEIPFEVHCYITARSIDKEVTQAWLDKYGFPRAKLYSVGAGESKIDVARESGAEIFVDDSYENFVQLNNAGIFTYLYTAPYNVKYNVGHRRIDSLKEIA